MKRFTFLCAFALFVLMGLNAQYNYLENAAGQHGGIIVGDVDNDGDLDIFMFGETRVHPIVHSGGLYINDGLGNFTKKESPVMPGWHTDMDFGDIDGDGDLDIIFSGHKTLNIPEANSRGIALNDGAGNFTIADPNLYPKQMLVAPSVKFADFNNDGLLDYMIAPPDHQRHWDWETGMDTDYYGVWTLYFQQQDGTFVADGQQFANYFRDQVLSVGDFDNDGDIDIFLQGYYPHADESVNPFGLTAPDWVTIIFTNDGTGQFSRLEGTGFPSIGQGSHDWADIDGDGFLDLLIVGDGFYNGNNNWDAAPWYHRIFTNKNLVFSQVFESPRARQFSITGANLLQDLDNDGDIDVLLGGWADNIGRQKTFIFENRDTDFNLTAEDLVENTMLGDYLPGLSEQDYKAADFNGDNILDYVYMGFKGNNETSPPPGVIDQVIGAWTPGVDPGGLIQPFTKLNAPSSLVATQQLVDGKMKVTFQWQAPDNIGTKKSVTYNLAVRNTTTGKWVSSPLAIVGGANDGFRQVVKLGNTYLNKTWTLTLPEGEYEWTVQAIDASRFGGSFAPLQPLTVSTGIDNQLAFNPIISSTKGNLVIKYSGAENLQTRIYSLAGVKVADRNFNNELILPLQAGVYLVELIGNSGSYKTKVLVK